MAKGAGAGMLAGMMLADMTLGGAGLVGRGFVGPGLVGLIVAISFSAGLNVYATTATLGLLAHTRWVELPPGLHVLTSWWVIGASLLLFGIEFFADKIPAFDLFWNALHTFVRIPVAALMAYGATSQLSPEMQLVATLAGGAIALAAHGGKTAARVAVTPSPEPVSNIATERERRRGGGFCDGAGDAASDCGGCDRVGFADRDFRGGAVDLEKTQARAADVSRIRVTGDDEDLGADETGCGVKTIPAAEGVVILVRLWHG